MIERPTTEKEKPKEIYHKRTEKSKSTGVAFTRQDQTDGAKIDKEVIKVGKHDVHEVESKKMEERLLTENEKVCLNI